MFIDKLNQSKLIKSFNFKKLINFKNLLLILNLLTEVTSYGNFLTILPPHSHPFPAGERGRVRENFKYFWLTFNEIFDYHILVF
jgi:hypothetical protein